jgi:hypothetical protein
MLGLCATVVKLPLEQLCVGRRRTKGALNRKNWGEREGPNVAISPTLTHACPLKGCPPSQGTAALNQLAQYCFPNGVTVQNCSRFKTI